MPTESPSKPQRARTVAAMLQRTVAEKGSRPAFVPLDPQAPSLSWSELARRAARLAVALQASGLGPGDRIAHISENRLEWVLSDLALHLAQLVHVPSHITLSPQQIAFQIEHSEASLALVSSAELLSQIAPLYPELRYIVYDDFGDDLRNTYQAETLDEFTATVAAFDLDEVLSDAAAAARPGDLATILYTSGTTGDPKGVMLTQENLAFNASIVAELADGPDDELRLNFLPLSHIFARTCDLYCWVHAGARLAIARSRDSLVEDCQAVHPDAVSLVPFAYEKLIQGLVQHGVADQPAALRQLLGGKINRCTSGGATLPGYVEEFFANQDVDLMPGYGLTESSPVITMTRPGQSRLGTIGQPIDGIEVRIAEDGEILTRGPHVMTGYWKNDAATAATIRDGWLYTGDLGEIDEAGHVIFRGRKKELIVLSTGKNVTPAFVEDLLTGSPLILQALVVGNDRKHLAALIVPDLAHARADTRLAAVAAETSAAFLQEAAVREVFAAEIADRLAATGHEEQIRKFHLLDTPFTIEGGELTTKLSKRRSFIEQKYAVEINALYA